MAVLVKFEGGKELADALGQLPKATGRNVLNRTLKKGTEHVRDVWQSIAPQLTGQYERSIVEGPNSKLTARQKKDAKRESKHLAERHVGTSDPAGQQQEFGNINHPANPSGRPAWDTTQRSVLTDIKKDMWTEIDKSRARLAKKTARLA
jgi:hypothetical protein